MLGAKHTGMRVSDVPFPRAAIAVALLAVTQGCNGAAPGAGDRDASDAGLSDGSRIDDTSHDGSSPDAGLSDGGSEADTGDDSAPVGTGSACAPSPQIHGNLKPLWSTTLGTGLLAPYVATDSANDIVVVGSTYGSITVDGQDLRRWRREQFDPVCVGSSTRRASYGITHSRGKAPVGGAGLDSTGNIFIAGSTYGFAGPHPDFGAGPVQGTFYLVKLDPQGNVLWTYSPTCDAQVSDRLSSANHSSGDAVVGGISTYSRLFHWRSGRTRRNSRQGIRWWFLTEFDATSPREVQQVLRRPLWPAVQFDPSGNVLVVGFGQRATERHPLGRSRTQRPPSPRS